ncbi:DNA-3-methyladenine glycosylase [Rhodococcus triatomae]|uniref:Putative 3-methyladenine DNA glycosylase n=1 Tax=Rhodococcus triatomae TaxID=300028 RepID=A0A1G8CF31_9NOCA|nr:DNA-3-methyladenine glycosylase [Rhodococcus triatomae]SDH43793.1 DNA-3-methyladenine glycosylase [Rhodococcus triatomae]
MSSERLSACAPVEAAGLILGGCLVVDDVEMEIVEVEAYGGDPDGPWPDPAAHSYRGPTPRNSVMFGPAGRLYVYRSYGLHFCMNVSTGPPGTASAVLLRAGRVLRGDESVRARRGGARPRRDWARGPGNLGSATGISLDDNGADLFDPASRVRLGLGDAARWESGPRVGVSAASERPWRLWIPGAPEVSAYRRSPRALVADSSAW